MYNRYIPQPDGTYRRNRMPDRSPVSAHPSVKQNTPQPIIPQIPEEDNCAPSTCVEAKPSHPPQHHASPTRKEKACHKDTGVDSFLHRIIPKDFDTGDLLIIILLLLIAGDCQEEQNSALLTLLIYFLI